MRMGMEGGEVGLALEREKRSWGGEKMERVPVPVRSGRCSPSERIWRIRLRYWCSSWFGLGGTVMLSLGDRVGSEGRVTALAFSARNFVECASVVPFSTDAEAAIFERLTIVHHRE